VAGNCTVKIRCWDLLCVHHQAQHSHAFTMTASHGSINLLHPLFGRGSQDAEISIKTGADLVAEHAAQFAGCQIYGWDVIAVVAETKSVLFRSKTEIINHITRRAGC